MLVSLGHTLEIAGIPRAYDVDGFLDVAALPADACGATCSGLTSGQYGQFRAETRKATYCWRHVTLVVENNMDKVLDATPCSADVRGAI